MRQADSVQVRPLLFASLILGVAGWVVLVYWPVLSAQAISFDDTEAITGNHLIQEPGWSSLGRIFSEVQRPSTIKGYYRPLTQVSLMFDWAMGGRPENLRQFHRTSLALHVVNTLLLLFLVYQLIGDPIAAALSALLFGLHPLTVEPVSWVMERKTLLAATFAFLSLLLYLNYVRKPNMIRYLLVTGTYLAAVLSKPTSAPLPLVMLLMDIWPLRRFSHRTVIEKLPLLIIAGLSGIVTCLSEQEVNHLTRPGDFPLLEVPLRGCYTLVFYLIKILYPTRLSSVYELPEPLSWTNMIFAGSFLSVVALAGLLFYYRRKFPVLWLGALTFLVILSPTLGLVRYSWVWASDKYLYIPFLGVALIVAWFLARVRRAGGTGAILVLLIAIGLAAAEARTTRANLRYWINSETLIRHFVELAPRSPFARAELGRVLCEQGQYEEALPCFDEWLAQDPQNAMLHLNTGIILAQLGRHEEAINHYRRALVQRPEFVSAMSDMALSLTAVHSFDEAIDTLKHALSLRPQDSELLSTLATILTVAGRSQEARQYMSQELTLAAKSPHTARPPTETLMLRGSIFAREGSLQEAILDFRKALNFAPGLAPAHFNLGLALSKQATRLDAATKPASIAPSHMDGPSDKALARRVRLEAIDELQRSVNLNPSRMDWRIALAETLVADNQLANAIHIYEQILSLKPDLAVAHNNLAWLLATHAGLPDDAAAKALEHAQRACALADPTPDMLDTLAAAYAAAGRFNEAIQAAEKAIEVSGGRSPATDAAVRARLKLYAASRPYREATNSFDSQPAPGR